MTFCSAVVMQSICAEAHTVCVLGAASELASSPSPDTSLLQKFTLQLEPSGSQLGKFIQTEDMH